MKQGTSVINTSKLLTYLGMTNAQRPDAASVKRYSTYVWIVCVCVCVCWGRGVGGGGGIIEPDETRDITDQTSKLLTYLGMKNVCVCFEVGRGGRGGEGRRGRGRERKGE